MRVFLVFCLMIIFLYNMNDQKFSSTFFRGYLAICGLIIITGFGSFYYIDKNEPKIASDKEVVSTLEHQLTNKDMSQQERDNITIQLTEKKSELDNFHKNKSLIELAWR